MRFLPTAVLGFALLPVTLALSGQSGNAPATQQEPSAPPTAQPDRPADAMPACPVRIISARLLPRHNPTPLLDPRNMQTKRVFGTVRIQYQNTSPKEMRDVSVGVHVAGPPKDKSAVPETMDPNAEYLTLPGPHPGQARWATQPVTLDAISLISIQPTGATFTDGTTWQAPDSGTNIIPEGACSWIAPGQLRPAGPQPVSAK